MKILRSGLVCAAVLFAASAHGETVISGFGTLGVGKNLNKDDKPTEPAYPDTKSNWDANHVIGLNLRSVLNEKFSFNGQLIMDGDKVVTGKEDNDWEVKFNWGYLAYKPITGTTISIGRQLFPSTVHSEYRDVRYLLPWTKTPYQLEQAFFIKSFNGIKIRQDVQFEDSLFYAELLHGTYNYKNTAGSGTLTTKVPEVTGGSLNFEYGDLFFKVFHSMSNMQTTLETPTGVTIGPVKAYKLAIQTATLRYDDGAFLGLYEYVRIKSDNAEELPPGNTKGLLEEESTINYLTLGYRFAKWMPHATYMYGDTNYYVGRAGVGKTHTKIIGLNYYFDSPVVAKMEYTHISLDDDEDPGFLISGETGQTLDTRDTNPNKDKGGDAHNITFSVDFLF